MTKPKEEKPAYRTNCEVIAKDTITEEERQLDFAPKSGKKPKELIP